MTLLLRFTFLLTFAAAPLVFGVEDANGVALYQLKDDKIELPATRKTPLDKLQLADEPWVAAREIELFDASSGAFYLKNKIEFPKKVPLRGKPFMFVIGGKPALLGAVWAMESSMSPPQGTPTLDRFGMYADGTVLVCANLSSGEIKDDPAKGNVIDALKARGLYRAGISFSAEQVQVERGAAEDSVSYTFTVKNNDPQSIYVLDPQRAGSATFHYLCNGATLIGTSKQRLVFRTEMKALFDLAHPPIKSDAFEMAWFTALKSGEEMTRTVKLAGYPHIPDGTYTCRVELHSPMHLPAKEVRRADGRIWCGVIYTAPVIKVGKTTEPEF